MIIRYDSIAALRAAYLANNAAQGAMSESLSWYNDETEAQTLRLALSGDTSLVPRAEALLWQFDQAIETPRRQWERSPAGPFCSVPDVIAGLPTPMRRMAHTQDEHAPIEIFVVTNSAGGLKAELLQKRGIAILALVIALSRVRPVMLYQTFMGNGSKDGTGETLLTAQINTSPLDLATACYVLTSAGFARRLTYELGRKLNNYTYQPPNRWSFDTPAKYELEMGKRLAIGDPNRALVIGRSNLHDPILSNPMGWVKMQIERFTQQDENEDQVR